MSQNFQQDIGFSLEYEDSSGKKTVLVFHYLSCFIRTISFCLWFVTSIALFFYVFLVIGIQPILPYKRYESDQVSYCFQLHVFCVVTFVFSPFLLVLLQGNFCACIAGNYKLVWDNSYSSFFSKVPEILHPSNATNLSVLKL